MADARRVVGERVRAGGGAVRWGRLRRVAPVVFLALAAPICAEYLVGYDDTIGDPAALIFGLVVFVPVYGAPAVLIRELARRRGCGWPGIFLLAAAFGLLQAGLLDQSLFNPRYRGIAYWDHLWRPTLLPGGWTSAAMLLGFVGGHVVGSISAPIAVAEAVVPGRAGKPRSATGSDAYRRQLGSYASTRMKSASAAASKYCPGFARSSHPCAPCGGCHPVSA
jgi:hypothetical protein